MWTFCTRPIIARKAIVDDPPYDTSGNGMPVTGMMPIVIPMFSKTCQATIVIAPTQM